MRLSTTNAAELKVQLLSIIKENNDAIVYLDEQSTLINKKIEEHRDALMDNVVSQIKSLITIEDNGVYMKGYEKRVGLKDIIYETKLRIDLRGFALSMGKPGPHLNAKGLCKDVGIDIGMFRDWDILLVADSSSDYEVGRLNNLDNFTGNSIRELNENIRDLKKLLDKVEKAIDIQKALPAVSEIEIPEHFALHTMVTTARDILLNHGKEVKRVSVTY